MHHRETIAAQARSKLGVLKAFAGWLPMAIFCLIFYGAMSLAFTFYILVDLIGIENARLPGLVIGIGLLVAGIYFYLRYLTNSLSSYILEVTNGRVVVKGTSGWRTINKELPLDSISSITIGGNINKFENIAGSLGAGTGLVADIKAGRLVFFTKSRERFYIDFADKAFEPKSLVNILLFFQENGVVVQNGA